MDAHAKVNLYSVQCYTLHWTDNNELLHAITHCYGNDIPLTVQRQFLATAKRLRDATYPNVQTPSRNRNHNAIILSVQHNNEKYTITQIVTIQEDT